MIAILVNDGVARRDAEFLAWQRALRARRNGRAPDAAGYKRRWTRLPVLRRTVPA